MGSSVLFTMPSRTICCGCNVFKIAKIITGIEIVLIFILVLTILGDNLLGNSRIFWIFTCYSEIPCFLGHSALVFLVIYLPYLATEFIGIHKKIRDLIIFSCTIRVILTALQALACAGTFISLFIFHNYYNNMRWEFAPIPLLILLYTNVPIMCYFIPRTWIQMKVLYADRDNATFDNTAELQILPPAYNNCII